VKSELSIAPVVEIKRKPTRKRIRRELIFRPDPMLPNSRLQRMKAILQSNIGQEGGK